MSMVRPCLIRSVVGAELRSIRLGHPLLDDYLEFVGARARTNTWLAAAYDLKVFFSVVAKEPAAVTTADVFAFIKAQRAPRRGPRVVRLEDGEAGLSARTIKRRLATVSGLFDYLVARGDAGVRANPVPRGMAARRAGTGSTRRGTPLLRAPRTLPRVLLPAEVDALMSVLRTHRDRAMVEAMLLGGLRRCEVLGLRLGMSRSASAGCSSPRARAGTSGSCRSRRGSSPPSPATWTPSGPRIRAPTGSSSSSRARTAATRCRSHGIDEIIRGARRRAGIDHLTCHQLRHTCLTRLREAGMALEAVQAQAGHRSIESTRVYLHLSAGWLASEYTNALAAIDAQTAAAPAAAPSAGGR